MPVTIVLGYDGFSSEFSLREGLVTFLEEEGKGEGYGVPSFPQLIICGKHSLVKSNGRPYLSPMRDGYWDFMLSSKANPVLLMLELIWTKLSLEFDVDMPWEDDLEIERLNEFLRAKPVIHGDQGGWMLKYDALSKKNLDSREPSVEWQPIEITSSIYSLFLHLTKNNICTTDSDFIEFAESDFGSVSKCVSEITSTNFVSFDGKFLSLNSENLITSLLPDGRFVVADNISGRFDTWVKNNFSA